MQIIKYNRVPLLDIGTMKLIKNGIIQVFPGIERFTADGVVFTDGLERKFDAVILGTGYIPALHDILHGELNVIDEMGKPLKSGMGSAQRNLYFCGFYTSPLGMLREIGREARRISTIIHEKTISRPSGSIMH